MSDLPVEREAMRKVVLRALEKRKVKANNFVAISRKIKLQELFEEESISAIDGWSITELFDANQGVTWGGSGCLDIYVVDKTMASSLESRVMYKTISGGEISAHKIDWERKYLVFPYIRSKSTWVRAFLHPSLGGDDALDFSIQVSNYEKGKDVQARLNYRIAKNIVNFPNAASYLVRYYKKLESREFEGEKLSHYNKSWYEYHRPRTPKLISKPKIVCKRMMKTAAFALDDTGYLPRDSVIALLPKEKLDDLRKNLEKVLQHKVTIAQTLEYTLAFLNSQMFQELLERRRSKKRGGYPIVDERMLQCFIIPRPSSKKAKKIEKILEGDVENVTLEDLCMPARKKQTKLVTQE